MANKRREIFLRLSRHATTFTILLWWSLCKPQTLQQYVCVCTTSKITKVAILVLYHSDGLNSFKTSNQLEHRFLNIKLTRMCSYFGNRTRTPYFWLQPITNDYSMINEASFVWLKNQSHPLTSELSFKHPSFDFNDSNLPFFLLPISF